MKDVMPTKSANNTKYSIAMVTEKFEKVMVGMNRMMALQSSAAEAWRGNLTKLLPSGTSEEEKLAWNSVASDMVNNIGMTRYVQCEDIHGITTI